MKARKWIPEKREYVGIDLPDGCSVYEPDMDIQTTCPCCREQFPFGEMYTSHIYQTLSGCAFGYAICESCYEKELAEELRYRKLKRE